MTNASRFAVALLTATAALVASGCDQQRHAAESTGRQIDRAAQTAGERLDHAATEATQKSKEAAAKAASAIDDAALTAKVKAALFAEPGLKSLQIDVATHDGVVTLAGTVDTPVLHERAVQIAGALMGVRKVVDRLVVKAA
jgi:hyperosmotically inducible protein